MQKTILTILILFVSASAILAQWANPGSNPHTAQNPEIESVLPNLIFDIGLATGHGGLTFESSGNSESKFAYRPATNKFIMGPTALEADAILTIDLDANPITDTTDGYFILGEPGGLRMVMDKNDIQVKNTPGTTGLFLNRFGGNVNIGDDGLVWDVSNQGVAINKTDALNKLDVNGDMSLSDGTGALHFRESDVVRASLKFDGNDLILINNDTTPLPGNLELTTQGDIHFSAGSSFSAMVIEDSGKVGIGLSNPAFDLQVAGNVDILGELTAASDRNLKRNITKLQNASSLITALNPVSYFFKAEEFPEKKLATRKKMGLIAQEVEKVLPNLVSEAGTAKHINGEEINVKSVNYIELIPLLIKGMQEQQAEINRLSNELQQLKQKNSNTVAHHIASK